MKAYNATHLYLEQISAEPGAEGAVIDSFYVIKDKHESYDQNDTLATETVKTSRYDHSVATVERPETAKTPPINGTSNLSPVTKMMLYLYCLLVYVACTFYFQCILG